MSSAMKPASVGRVSTTASHCDSVAMPRRTREPSSILLQT